MDKVYIILYYINYDTQVIVGVFSSRALAKANIKNLNVHDPDNYSVEEWTVNG